VLAELAQQLKTSSSLSMLKSSESEDALFVHCQTTLIEAFQVAYPDLKYEKSGVIFDSNQSIQADVIKQFIYLALSYHSRKKLTLLCYVNYQLTGIH
jgi:hypothetical protein